MAKQIGLNITGRMDNYSFYHDRVHGFLVRRTGGVTSKQYNTDDRYAAARDASSEFALVSATGKLIRNALNPFIDQVKDSSMVNRLNKELVALKQSDTKHPRGKRKAETMMSNSNANKWFRIFQFNDTVKTYDLLEYFSAAPDAKHRVPAKMKLRSSAFPEGATHAGLTLVRTVIDFEKKEFITSSSPMVLVPMESKNNEVSLITDHLPSKNGTEITCLQILFFREQNGRLIQLKERVHAMGIIGVNNSAVKHSIRKNPVRTNSHRLKASISYINKSKQTYPQEICLPPPLTESDTRQSRQTFIPPQGGKLIGIIKNDKLF